MPKFTVARILLMLTVVVIFAAGFTKWLSLQHSKERNLQFHQRHEGKFTLHRTLDLHNIVLVFTERGQKFFNSEQRRCLGRKTREAFMERMSQRL